MTETDSKGRYANRPGDMSWRAWKSILSRVYVTMSNADLTLRCAGVAYYGFLSIFPMLACFVLVYGLVTTPASLQQQLSILEPLLPQAVNEILLQRLSQLIDQPDAGLGIGLVVSLAIAFWSGSRGTSAMISAISRTYLETDDRSFIAGAFLSLGLTLAALVFMILVLVAVAATPLLVNVLPFEHHAETLALWLRWPFLAVMVWVAISVLYRIAPHREGAKVRWITPGAALATVLWLVLSALFSLYVENFANYNATFGSLSAAVVMLLWFYYSTSVVLLGAGINAELEHQTSIDTTTGPARPMGERGAYVADHVASQKD